MSNTEQMREALHKIAFEAVGMREVVEIARAALTAPAAEPEQSTRLRGGVPEGVAYFSYSTDSGYIEHSTADGAKKYAQADLDGYRQDAMHDNEWPDEADSVCWGVVLQKTTAIDNSEAAGQPSFDYELAPFTAAPQAPAPAVDAGVVRDAERWRKFVSLDYKVRREWAANLSLTPVLVEWVDSLPAMSAQAGKGGAA